jgi:mono/diheme cytochrome c family protein
LKSFLFGLALGVVIVPLAVFGYFVTGAVPVGTASKAMPFERVLAGSALHARILREMPKTAPIAADESNYAAGARIYREQCAVCHGLPGGALTAIAGGMYPKPPQLFHGKGVTDDEAGETYWKVENGIRLTGMPGFKRSLSSTQMWQVSLLLANANKLPDSVKQALAPESPASSAPPAAAPATPPSSSP